MNDECRRPAFLNSSFIIQHSSLQFLAALPPLRGGQQLLGVPLGRLGAWTAAQHPRQLAHAHVLEDAGTPLSKIFLRETKAPANKYRVKTLVSFLYFSPMAQRRLERAGKEWKVVDRKFKRRDDAERYVTRKKQEVLRFIKSREG